MRYRKLLKKREEGFIPLEGIRLICDSIEAGVEITELFISEGCFNSEYGVKLKFLIEKFQLPFVEISTDISESISDTKTPQGAFAISKWFPKQIDEALFENERYFIALDGVSDPGNVGTIIRTAAAFGINGVICGPNCAKISNPKTIRASMGSIFRTNCYESKNLVSDILVFKKNKFKVFVAEADGESINKIDKVLSTFVLVIGGEAFGPSPDILKIADNILSIPMCSGVESLNAGIAAGILMYELSKKH